MIFSVHILTGIEGSVHLDMHTVMELNHAFTFSDLLKDASA